MFVKFYGSAGKGFSLLELQISLFILVAGVVGLSSLLRSQTRQLSASTSWLDDYNTYYLTAQTNTWMRQLRSPAEISDTQYLTAFEPDVTGDAVYTIRVEQYLRDIENKSASVTVVLE